MGDAAGWWRLILGLQAVATAVMVVWKIISLRQLGPGQEYGSPFFHAMATSDWFGAVVSTSLLIAAVRTPPRCAMYAERLVDGMARRVPLVAVLTSLMLCIGTQLVHRNYPYSMDEYAATFQAEVFAAGRLTGEWPICAAPLMISPQFASGQFFWCNFDSGKIISQYWPCHSLLMSPFSLVGAPWLLNPLLAGVAIMLIASLARHFAGERAAGMAVLLTIASPVFHAYGISFYSMMSHLVANLLYARLLVQPSVSRGALAGCIGGCALTLHNPFPHALFAAPWIVWLVVTRRWVPAAVVVACSLSVFSVIDGAWFRTKHAVRADPVAVVAVEAQPSQEAPASLLLSWSDLYSRIYGYVTSLYVPTLPGAAAGRTYSLVREIAWDAPGLVGLAIMGFLVGSGGAASALAASALGTLAGYAFAPFDGGLGWGSRYMFSAWSALPVLAATATASKPGRERLFSAMASAAVGSALLCVPIRLFEIRSFNDANLSRAPLPLVQASGADPDRVWIFLAGGDDARQDFIRNDPLFRRGPFILYGQGRYQDEKNIRLIAAVLGLTARHMGSSRVGDVWVLEPGAPLADPADR